MAIRIGTPLHLRRHIREALWKRGILLFLSNKDGSFVETCEKLHISDAAIGKFLVLNPDTTKKSAQEISEQIDVRIDVVRVMIRIQETPPDQRAQLIAKNWDD